MKITDRDGLEITVTDLKIAISEADRLRGYRLEGEENKVFSDRRQAYWEDIFQKLLLLEIK